METYDASLKHPSSIIIAGQSGSGKSYFTRELLRNKNSFTPKPPKHVIYVYKEWQPLYDVMLKEQLIDEFIRGMPSEEKIKSIMKKHKKDGSVMIFDDLMSDIGKPIANCFTVYSHHLNCTVVLLIQSLFLESKSYKTCSLNAHYIILMKNKRDGASVSFLARQISPYNTRYITEAYLKATRKPYSYLLFDLRQETNDLIRIRSNIFSFPISVFIDENDAQQTIFK
jgi:GTPase SAR1 family protein